MSVDQGRGIVYLPIGSPAYDFYGGDRKGKNLFGNSIVALNASTGKLKWYFSWCITIFGTTTYQLSRR
jgi:quinoprotein glucose dehydrogenase